MITESVELAEEMADTAEKQVKYWKEQIAWLEQSLEIARNALASREGAVKGLRFRANELKANRGEKA